jgi:hypothetical protein
MKRLFTALAALSGLLLVLLVLAASAALQAEPSVSVHDEIQHQDIARAMALLRQHDPRRATPGVLRTAQLQERDLEVLLGHVARRWLQASSRVDLARGSATLHLSLHVPANPFGRWLNVELQLQQTGGLPVIAAAHLGRLPLPAWVAERAAVELARRAGLQAEMQLAAQVVRQVRFMPEQVQVAYAWQGDSSARVMAALLPAADLERLRVYTERLATLSEAGKPAWDAPLVRLLGPMFELARSRSAAGGDAAAENRAALTVLTLFANGMGVGHVLPAAKSWPKPRHLNLQLAGRSDFPQHFLVSATLAAEGTGPLSQAIGLYKEVTDSRSGSGFSFTDMAANRAGTRFGELAVQDPLRLQAALARGVQDADLVPATSDLPEFMPEPEFVRRFGGVGSATYNGLLADIDRRIQALPLLR